MHISKIHCTKINVENAIIKLKFSKLMNFCIKKYKKIKITKEKINL